MSLDIWRRLNELEKALREEFANSGCPKAGCPEGARVHMIYAHYGALVAPGRALDTWRYTTIDAYKRSEPKPREAGVAADFLAAHFLWVLARDVRLEELPNLEQAVKPTADDGGTLVHFQSASLGRTAMEVKSTAEAKIADFSLVDRQAEGTVARVGPHEATGAAAATAATGAAAATAATGAAATGAGATSGSAATGAAAGSAATGALTGAAAGAATSAAAAVRWTKGAGAEEDAPGIPKRRRFCLSIPGSPGEHKDVDLATSKVEGKLRYPVPSQHQELRLLGISPGFLFEIGGAAVGAQDPWTQSTRSLTVAQRGKRLEEKSSSTYVGKVVSSKWGVGIAKYAGEGTDTSELATRYLAQLGPSRVKIFKAVKNVEGACESVATYDGPKLSWGINQWTLPSSTGELWQILAFIHDFFPSAFARRFSYYGIGVWFASRASRWSAHNTYRDVLVYRLPCCGPQTRSALNAVFAGGKTASGVAANAEVSTTPPPAQRHLAAALRLSRNLTTSFAMCHVFTTAGADPDIQEAQAQWMSYRISSTNPNGKTISTVIDGFLKSLGSNMSSTARFNTALASLGQEYSRAQVKDLLAEKFSDKGASEDWIDWPTRCQNAGKATKERVPRKS